MNGADRQPTVFAVVPTFNRWTFTRACISHLKLQSHQPVIIIVADGGSTDGTREYAAADPDVIVAFDGVERWWAGSTALGIAEALQRARDDDFVLLINNDTVIPPDYLATLIRASRQTGAAVGAAIVDSSDPSKILDAGEYIDWVGYNFPVKTQIEPGESFCDVDVLPGRGSLVPIRMIRAAGNVDDVAFPHYLADYDLFCRIKAAGFRLGVSYETAILAYIEETGLKPKVSRSSFASIYRELFSRRSMTNVKDHLRFAGRHAPHARCAAVKMLILRRALARILFGSPLEPVARPLHQFFMAGRSVLAIGRAIWGERHQPNGRMHALRLPKPVRLTVQALALPRPLETDEIRSHGFDPNVLMDAGVVEVLPIEGWVLLRTLDPNDYADGRAITELARASVPLSPLKMRRMLVYRRARHGCEYKSRAVKPEPKPSAPQ